MRRILVDEARKRLSAKRGAGVTPESLDAVLTISLEPDLDILALHTALDELAALDPERARVVELRYIIGLSIEETAELLGRSPQSVSRDWTAARAWLARRLRPNRDRAG
jgi:RNA polymerase sigma factor (TIGR02999 family)